ncbi:MAG: c-type cytochrome [Gemmataceae bacterium]|nr:c-type cytochrome [Gemmataceae bacterium]
MKQVGLILGVMSLFVTQIAGQTSDTPAERGKQALLTRAYNAATWTFAGYENAWKHWQPAPAKQPADYDKAFRDYYGLHAASYESGRYPMGLREAQGLLFGKGLTSDCMLCHGGSIFGKSYVGLGNASLDIHALFLDLNRASTKVGKLPFTFSRVRGTSEAGGFATFLLSYREPDLSLRLAPLDLDLRDDLCEDVPAWWLLKKKKTMYHTGTVDARSVRSIMQFMLVPTNSAATFAKEEATFADIRQYIVSLEAPKYPLPIDRGLADKGRTIFNKTCSQCHGTYGDNWTYPNKHVPIDDVGTDRNRFIGLSRRLAEHYNKSWFSQGEGGYKSMEPVGYQAPPLDGVWATAPYFHNGAVPTIHDVLNSKSRPKIYTRSFTTGETDYDAVKVGWKVHILDKRPDAAVSDYERRKIYDTTQPGRGNQGHTFGDDLSDEQRRAVVEYLKTL